MRSTRLTKRQKDVADEFEPGAHLASHRTFPSVSPVGFQTQPVLKPQPYMSTSWYLVDFLLILLSVTILAVSTPPENGSICNCANTGQ
jgi:hypothetical protein